MIIDMHNHILPQSVLDQFQSDPAFGATLQGRKLIGANQAEFIVSPEFYDPGAKREELAAKRIDSAVLSLAPPAFSYQAEASAGERLARAANAGLAQFCTASPNHFRWMAHVPMQSPERCPAVLTDATAAGCVAVQIGTNIVDRRIDDPVFAQFWSAADKLDLPVMIHPAYNPPYPGLAEFHLHNAIGNLLETTIAFERLICSGLLERFKQLRLILVHGGGFIPYQAGRIRHAALVRPELVGRPTDPFGYGPRVFFDNLTHDPLAQIYLAGRAGLDQVMFGTDLPYDMAPLDPVDQLEQAFPSLLERERVSSANAIRLFRL